ncbi:MAG: ATP-binding cassette domain-containing protein [Candidatus Omnitrophica bacterium]|nr:ATP-binding cassette domain-containing protein [Candidatus Omnitrophota bacterium]MDD5437208.1 ATP-binding cassette domain-containing protein [Candidatus Omnitrophota bacterium]
MIILKCNNLTKIFPVTSGYLKEKTGLVKAVDGVSLNIEKGETFGLVGESGSGKTTLGKLILGILKPNSGSIELATDKPQVIFQDPYNSLDPKMRVGEIVAEGLVVGRPETEDRRPKTGDRRPETAGRVEEMLDLVRLPKGSINKYPHQFSGGERQRIAIARAVITKPEFIVCDEPVSSLDVTVQLQILKLLKEIQKNFGITYLFISHDLRIIRYMCDKIAVMKEGRIVEEGPTKTVYSNPSAPYTKLLLSSVLFYEYSR